jgi:hypothetical protein
MKKKASRRGSYFALTALLLAAPAAMAQLPGGPPPVRGVWSPVEGQGAVYEVEGKGIPKQQMEMAIVGSERVDGQTAYWFEIAMQDPRHGQMVMKMLYSPKQEKLQTVRMVMQMTGQPPMEMPMQMMGQMGKQAQEMETDFRDESEHVGSETITTPAGTFQCEHYRSKDGKVNVWIATGVHPYGLVRMTSPDANMILVRKLSDARTKIRGTPVRMDQMMPRPR